MGYCYEYDPNLEAAQVAVLRTTVGWDARIERYQRILGNTYLCVACFLEDELVGYVDVVSDGVDDAYIRDLMVNPEHQHRNIGSTLIGMVIDRVKPSGIKMLSVLFEPWETDLYVQAGFNVMSGGEIDFEA